MGETVAAAGRCHTHRVTEQRRVLGTGPQQPSSPSAAVSRAGTVAQQAADRGDAPAPQQPVQRQQQRRPLGQGTAGDL